MARSRANDYDDKRQAILDRSAELFSAHGYDRASMNKIAEACGVSKANLYHYYKDKEGLLFDVIRFHLEELLEVVETADDPGAPPEARLRGLIAALLEAYRDADSQHNVQISSMRFLPHERQTELKRMERDLVTIFSSAVVGVAPHLKGTKMLTPVTMSLFGMVNWHYLWFRSTGSVSRAEYADLVTRLIVDGARNVLKQPSKTSKRTAAAE
ncbi:TetR/AcrR family transcriptional regulator [Afipia massiliensis]|uniref:TetR/AcrR family transcriptional regulator n=1 Tax=Afipia massiliensis TaxID=211460 RepID=A0A840MRY5_9BRAD|nr:TetR/AcrR family transcriptional regulator [Afipia massiliensis]MBB5051179.1 TetR/AcrR family transcriptional regulator [Afipia massiliensis]